MHVIESTLIIGPSNILSAGVRACVRACHRACVVVVMIVFMCMVGVYANLHIFQLMKGRMGRMGGGGGVLLH